MSELSSLCGLFTSLIAIQTTILILFIKYSIGTIKDELKNDIKPRLTRLEGIFFKDSREKTTS